MPYVVFAVLCGIPLFLLETSIGQYTQEGFVTCWTKLCPLARGEVIYVGKLCAETAKMSKLIIGQFFFFMFLQGLDMDIMWLRCLTSVLLLSKPGLYSTSCSPLKPSCLGYPVTTPGTLVLRDRLTYTASLYAVSSFCFFFNQWFDLHPLEQSIVWVSGLQNPIKPCRKMPALLPPSSLSKFSNNNCN